MKPSSFCTISTYNCCFELVGLLLSLSIYHPNEIIYIVADSKTKDEIEKITPKPKLNIVWFVELNFYSDMDRLTMDKKGIWSEFQMHKSKVITYALESSSDTLFLDSDIIIFDTINDINNSKDIGVSRQYIQQIHIDKTGYYNGGMLWTKNKNVPLDWIKFTKTSRYYDQASIEDLAKHYSFFEFPDNYNLQCWRMLIANESPKQIESYISIINNRICYKTKPIKFIHTHFHDIRFKEFNQLIIQHLINSKNYKILLIIYRVIHNKWIIKIPKQPMSGLGSHNNDSFRQLPILYKVQHLDVDVQYINNSIHCWIEPNVLLYDRPNLLWLNNEIFKSSLLLLGNGDIEVEGRTIKEKNNKISVSPWIFWPRNAMVLEKILKKHNIKSYNDRSNESIFIGNIENSTQQSYRNNTHWKDVISEFYCTIGKTHIFKQDEYLMKLRDSKFGLCLRGYGSKCHREVELMAFGTVPIITSEVCVHSFMEPLIENTHYIYVKDPTDLQEKIKKISQIEWETMSNNCFDWYQRNVYSKNSWNTMIHRILFEL